MEPETSTSILNVLHKYQIGFLFAFLGALGHVLAKAKDSGYSGFWVSVAAGVNAFIVGFMCLLVVELWYGLQVASVAGIFGAYLGGESIHILTRVFRNKTGIDLTKKYENENV